MPLSEFLKMARGKLESGQEKRSSTTDLSSCFEDELVELVWENGQIMMQSQSSRSKKSPTFDNLPSSSLRVKDKFTRNSSTTKIGKFGVMDSMLDNMPISVPNDEMDLTEEDEVVPWLSYSADDSPQQDYHSPLLPEISGLTVNEASGRRGFASMDKRGISNQMNGDSHSVPIRNIVNLEQGNASKLSPSIFNLLCSGEPEKSSAPILPLGSRVSDMISGNTSCNMPVSAFAYSNSSQASAGVIKSMKMQKQNIPGNGSSLLNFTHFSRPITGGSAVSGSSTIGARGNIERDNVGSSRNRVREVPFESYFSSEKENDVHSPPYMASSKVESKGSVGLHERSCPMEQFDNLCGDGPSNNDMSRDQFTGVNAIKEFPDGERNVEPVVVCSSVCSGSSAERTSSDHPRTLKRKTRDNEESEFQSEDVEEESVGIKSADPARGGAGSKRSRAAEVHNLSERRRRDRINEKMRALQDLIPNCNKADKASMLDEAIEYLKTLQVQVQIMSMGAGLCAPPMMFPAGMQHMHAAHMPQFSPMGLGMGMGTLEMNGGSPGCSIYPMPTMQGAHLRSPPVSGSATFPGVAGSNHHSFRHPGQGLPVLVPPASLVPLAGKPSTNAAVGSNITNAGVHTDIRNTSTLDPETKDALRTHI